MKADAVTKNYLSDPTVFADVFNYFIHGGRQCIQSEQLEERDTTKITLPYGADGAVVPVQKYRDVQKLYAAMTDGETEYVLYGIESQSEVHYAAAVKNNLYDAIEYASQVEIAARLHRRTMKKEKEISGTAAAKGQKKLNSGEFLSGFWKSDRLIPSVTVMIWFSPDEWDGPLRLSDMMEVKDPKIFSFINDYRVHLIAPAQMTDEEIMKFQTSLREVLLFIKYSKDQEKLIQILKTNEERFREVERRAVDVIEALTNTKIKYEEEEGVVNMCKAIQDMKAEEQRIGEQRGELKKAQEAAWNFYNLGVDIETVARGVGYALETVRQWLGLETI